MIQPNRRILHRPASDPFNSLSPSSRIEVQEALRDRGDYWDAIDGVAGPGTRRAIIDAGRAELSVIPDLDLESEENVRAWLLSLIGTATDESSQAQPASIPESQGAGVDAGGPNPARASEEASEGSAAAWHGDWRCEITSFVGESLFDGPARFTFEEDQGTLHNIGSTLTHYGAQPIGGRANAVTIEFADGAFLGLLDIRPDAMIVMASVGVFDCMR